MLSNLEPFDNSSKVTRVNNHIAKNFRILCFTDISHVLVKLFQEGKMLLDISEQNIWNDKFSELFEFLNWEFREKVIFLLLEKLEGGCSMEIFHGGNIVIKDRSSWLRCNLECVRFSLMSNIMTQATEHNREDIFIGKIGRVSLERT